MEKKITHTPFVSTTSLITITEQKKSSELTEMPEALPKKHPESPFVLQHENSSDAEALRLLRNADTFFLGTPGKHFGIQNPQHIPASRAPEAWGDWGLLPAMGRKTECPWFVSCYLPALNREKIVFQY